jgi:hypothetical protein
MTKSRRMGRTGHVARMWNERNAYKILVGKPERKGRLERSRQRRESNIKMDLKQSERVDQIHPAQDEDQWRPLMNLRIPYKAGI